MHKVDQMPQSRPRAIAEGMCPMDAQLLASSRTNPGGITPSPTPPDPEVTEKEVRRRFTADYKLRILRKADACTQLGQVGALLWRKRFLLVALDYLAPATRGGHDGSPHSEGVRDTLGEA